MALVADRCICLRVVEYSETSQILTLFSRGRGLLKVIAKGAHRRTKAGASKFDGGVDLLDVGQAVFTDDAHRELSTLTEWKLQEGQLGLRRSLRGLYLALSTVEWTSMLFEEHDAHPDVFDHLEHVLGELASPRREEAYLAFTLDVLRDGGYLPETAACASCGGLLHPREPAYFSPDRGGVICRNCEAGFPDRSELDPRLLRLLQGILNLPRAGGRTVRLPHLTRHQTDPLNRMLTQHVEHTLGRPLRTSAYVGRAAAAAVPTPAVVPDRAAAPVEPQGVPTALSTS